MWNIDFPNGRYWDMSGNTSKWLIDWIFFIMKFIQLHEEGTSVHEDCRLKTVELYSMWGDWVTKTQLFYEPGTTAFLYFLNMYLRLWCSRIRHSTHFTISLSLLRHTVHSQNSNDLRLRPFVLFSQCRCSVLSNFCQY